MYLGLATWKLSVQANDSNIFFTSTLLTLHESSSAVNADNKTSSDLGAVKLGNRTT